MSVQNAKLCSVLLLQHFGESVQSVGECLFSAVQSRTLTTIIKNTGLPKSTVTHALAILLKFRLARFQPSNNELYAEYILIRENVLLILRYPRYVHLVNTKLKNGELAAAMVEELLRAGSQTATRLLAKVCDDKTQFSVFEDTFRDLCQFNYIIRAPVVVGTTTESSDTECSLVPRFVVDETFLYTPPTLSAVEWDKLRQDDSYETTDKGKIFKFFKKPKIFIDVFLDIFWVVNMDRFHQDFRDHLMISAVERKIDANAGECLKHILQQMYVCTSPWMVYSNPISFADIKHQVEAKSANAELNQYLDQYVSILCEYQ